MSKKVTKKDDVKKEEVKKEEVKKEEVKKEEAKKEEVKKEEAKKEEVKKEEAKKEEVKKEKVKKEKVKKEKVKKEKVKKEKSESNLDTSSSSDSEKVRRVLSNDEVEKTFNNLLKTVDDEVQLLRDNKNHSVGVRFLRNVSKQLKLLKTDSFRLLNKKVRKNVVRNGNSGFMKNVKISPEMAKFCNFKQDQLVSRVDVTKYICNYVKENNLQNQDDRRQFVPDEKLASILGEKDTVTYYTLQKYIQKHFPKA
jgi:chromatin remodeling complex protein RSC6